MMNKEKVRDRKEKNRGKRESNREERERESGGVRWQHRRTRRRRLSLVDHRSDGTQAEAVMTVRAGSRFRLAIEYRSG
ncbi:hypothetical protein Hanom_Chr07g00621461 [Helianthus anomalus]